MAKKTFLLPPDSQEREYTRILLRFVRALQADINEELIPKVGSIKSSFDAAVKVDSWSDDIAAIFYWLSTRATFRVDSERQNVKKIHDSIERFNDSQFLKVVMANKGGSLGVNPFRSEPYLAPLSEAFMTDNMALIKSLPVKLHEELEGILRRGVMNGDAVKSIQKEIKARYGVSEYRARLIAQDQTLKFHSRLSEYRLKSIGVDKYTWKTVGDSRVRPEHVSRNGNVYSWDKPPAGGNHPGLEVRCRCRADPVFD